MQGMFHRSYKTVIGSGGVTCSCCHALQPVCACALTWTLKNGRSYPVISRKELGLHLLLELCGTNINEKSSFSWDFTEMSSLRQGTIGPNQGQCQCAKCSRHDTLGSAGGRTKAMKICMGAAFWNLKNKPTTPSIFKVFPSDELQVQPSNMIENTCLFPFLGELVLCQVVKSVTSILAQTS